MASPNGLANSSTSALYSWAVFSPYQREPTMLRRAVGCFFSTSVIALIITCTPFFLLRRATARISGRRWWSGTRATVAAASRLFIIHNGRKVLSSTPERIQVTFELNSGYRACTPRAMKRLMPITAAVASRHSRA